MVACVLACPARVLLPRALRQKTTLVVVPGAPRSMTACPRSTCTSMRKRQKEQVSLASWRAGRTWEQEAVLNARC